MLQSGATGAPIATLDGTRLTLWRTAAASALAARYLARADAKRLLIVGAGQLAPYLARAHASVRPIETIAVWNHRTAGAHRLAAALADEGFNAHVVTRLEDGVREADIDLLRDAVGGAAGRRRLAQRPASTSTSSAPSRCRCARPTTRR